MIRAEVNGAKSRFLHSYSKSLAACLLKYNNYADNELHLLIDNAAFYDTVSYKDSYGIDKIELYSILDRLIDDYPYFEKPGQVQLHSFVIDVSDNHLVDLYLQKYTGVGKKKMASPEKDREVVVFNPLYDAVIKNHMDALYVIYALQMKYGFLLNRLLAENFINDICCLDNIFYDSGNEKMALCDLIKYISENWKWEQIISESVLKDSANQVHLSLYYDPILQYYGIQNDTFEETVDLINYYNSNVITDLALKYCWMFLNRQ